VQRTRFKAFVVVGRDGGEVGAGADTVGPRAEGGGGPTPVCGWGAARRVWLLNVLRRTTQTSGWTRTGGRTERGGRSDIVAEEIYRLKFWLFISRYKKNSLLQLLPHFFLSTIHELVGEAILPNTFFKTA